MKSLDRKLRLAATRDENATAMLSVRIPASQMEWLRTAADGYGVPLSVLVRLIIAEAREALDS